MSFVIVIYWTNNKTKNQIIVKKIETVWYNHDKG